MTEYQIRVTGHLAPHRFHGFDHLTISYQPNGETIIEGSIPDQAALFGLLNWLYDLGIPLVSVKPLGDTHAEHTSQPYHSEKD
jgi:hypothetical protein